MEGSLSDLDEDIDQYLASEREVRGGHWESRYLACFFAVVIVVVVVFRLKRKKCLP